MDTKVILQDIRGFLMNFQETAAYAMDFNLSEIDLIKIAHTFGVL
jgi:hypothetical protein